MITVIPRKIAATSVNGVAVANDGSITLPVDSTPTSNSTNLVTSGGVKTELDALSARIGNAENPAQVWTDIPFTIPTSNWNLSNGKYTTAVQSSSILATSGVFVNYNDLDNAVAPIVAEESTGQVTFTTETIPSGTIAGTFRIIDSVNGIVPLARGGTGVAATSNENLLTQLGAAPLASPSLIGTPTAPTATAGTNTTQIATTAFVHTATGNLASGMAILANGNTHAAIASGQYAYVHGHDSLSEGLYRATAAIAANGTLSTSNLTAVNAGGLNALQTSIDTLNSKTATKKVATGTTSFSALDGNSYASRALDRIHAQIGNLSSGIHQVESGGGPIYFVVLGKYQNSYYGGYLFTYGTIDTTLSYRFAYQDGTYAIYVVGQ